MTRRPLWKRVLQTAATIAVGGSAFQAVGCAERMSEALLDGLASGINSTAQAIPGVLIADVFPGLFGGTGG